LLFAIEERAFHRDADFFRITSRLFGILRNINISAATSSGSNGIVGTPPMGCQPSPRRAARRIACLLWPPIQIGIVGFLHGLGEKDDVGKVAIFAAVAWVIAGQSSLNAAMYSSVTLPRSSNGSVPRVSNSSFHPADPGADDHAPAGQKHRDSRASSP